MIGAALGSVVTGIAAMSSASAAGSDAAATTQAQMTAATSSATAPAVVVVRAPAAYPGDVAIKVASRPTKDPILGGRRLGTRSSAVHGTRGTGVSSDLNSTIEDEEFRLLASQQESELLEIFEDSRGVHRLISRFGGDPDDASYFVRAIDANEDQAVPGTSWVTATLRADFASPEGKRGIEMQVYRKKTADGRLDNTPYVALTQVSYIDEAGNLSTATGEEPSDDLQTIRFKN